MSHGTVPGGTRLGPHDGGLVVVHSNMVGHAENGDYHFHSTLTLASYGSLR